MIWQQPKANYSYGLGLTWNSPIGPLKFSYARPIGAKDREKIQRFQFQIGTVILKFAVIYPKIDPKFFQN